MFCGWRQIQDKPRLVELGSGTLEIDALSGECAFNSSSISPLGIGTELRLWLGEDLEAHSIPTSALDSAWVRADLNFSEISEPERTTSGEFYVRGRSQRSSTWHRCQVRCRSEVVSGSDVYTSEYSDLEEWPSGWPAG
jgi:hypothetical protein